MFKISIFWKFHQNLFFEMEISAWSVLSNVLKFSQYLRLGVLINNVLIKRKKCMSHLYYFCLLFFFFYSDMHDFNFDKVAFVNSLSFDYSKHYFHVQLLKSTTPRIQMSRRWSRLKVRKFGTNTEDLRPQLFQIKDLWPKEIRSTS